MKRLARAAGSRIHRSALATPAGVWAASLVLVFGGGVFFYGLGDFPVLLWDEGRLAVNALEMTQNAEWITTYYDGEPDAWNTKPPLAIWLMAGSMNLLGFSELAVRLPSALSGMATMLLVFAMCVRFLRDPLVGLAAGIVLASSVGFIGEHVARTGDYDALLTLWVTVYSLSFFLYVEAGTAAAKRRYLGVAAAAFVLAVLTKSVAALLGLPALGAYALSRRKVGAMFREPVLYVAAASACVIIAGYYLLREQQQPGYIATVVANEWGKPYVETVQGHVAPWWYYVQDLLTYKYVPWVYAFPLFAAAGAMSARPRHRALARYALLVAGGYLLVISLAATKLPWYDAPLYPAAALAMGIGLTEIGRAVVNARYVSASPVRRGLAVVLLALGLVGPFSTLLIPSSTSSTACSTRGAWRTPGSRMARTWNI